MPTASPSQSNRAQQQHNPTAGHGRYSHSAGVISELNGPRSLEKIGAGTLVPTAANTYSGPTAITAGTLIVNGNSAVAVNSGAALDGTGTVGAITVNSNGTLAPGPAESPDVMTVVGNLAFQSAALYLARANPLTASRDNVTGSGTATLNGTVNATCASGMPKHIGILQRPTKTNARSPKGKRAARRMII
jgi:autotransporter-associated beta strand protein